jgi:hypothetical protein
MAAATLLDIMDGLEARLATVSGLRTTDVSPGQISPPCAIVGVPDIPEYRTTMTRGYWRPDPSITVLVSATLDRIGQRLLAEFAAPSGTRSIAAAIEADRTLGGRVDECYVASFRPLGLDEVGLIGYFGGVWTVTVSAPGR